VGQVLGLIITGLIVGALARLIIPGRQRMGILMTILVGVAGSLVGGFVGQAIFGRPGGFILAVICAALIVWLLSRTRRI
jgi:uncharacterized membrane protein YeaQ/YmgE (transglycosylase-associated protein family)